MKRTLITLSCILTALIGMTSVAQAMSPKINSTLYLTKTGSVHATGPFNGWDADEASAVVHVRITQGNKSVSGTSQRYSHGAISWSALATGDRMSSGAAVGHATASVRLTNGTTETYAWTVAVTLK